MIVGKASDVMLQSGSGTNKEGGSGGDFFAFAGDAASELQAGGLCGQGGSIYL